MEVMVPLPDSTSENNFVLTLPGPPIFLCELRDGVDSSDCLRIRDRSLEYGKALISSGTLTSEL